VFFIVSFQILLEQVYLYCSVQQIFFKVQMLADNGGSFWCITGNINIKGIEAQHKMYGYFKQ
jgi:hypothetical protein